MKRTVTLPADLNVGMLMALQRTVNRDPVWGKPALSLLLADVSGRRQEDGAWEVDIEVRDDFPLMVAGVMIYQPADWSVIEPSLPLAA